MRGWHGSGISGADIRGAVLASGELGWEPCAWHPSKQSSLTFLSLGEVQELQYLNNFKDVNSLLKVKCVLKSFVAYESQKASEAGRQER